MNVTEKNIYEAILNLSEKIIDVQNDIKDLQKFVIMQTEWNEKILKVIESLNKTKP